MAELFNLRLSLVGAWRNIFEIATRALRSVPFPCVSRPPITVEFYYYAWQRCPSTPARLSGHVVAVCSTIITAIWTIHRTYTAARHYLLAIISLTETAGADLLLLACHRYNWTVTATTLIGCHVSQNLRRYFSTLELWNWITYAFLEPVFYLLRDEFILELLERRKIENS